MIRKFRFFFKIAYGSFTLTERLTDVCFAQQLFKKLVVFSRRFRRKTRLLQWLVFLSVQRDRSTFCALMHFYHMYSVLYFQHIQTSNLR